MKPNNNKRPAAVFHSDLGSADSPQDTERAAVDAARPTPVGGNTLTMGTVRNVGEQSVPVEMTLATHRASARPGQYHRKASAVQLLAMPKSKAKQKIAVEEARQSDDFNPDQVLATESSADELSAAPEIAEDLNSMRKNRIAEFLKNFNAEAMLSQVPATSQYYDDARQAVNRYESTVRSAMCPHARRRVRKKLIIAYAFAVAAIIRAYAGTQESEEADQWIAFATQLQELVDTANTSQIIVSLNTASQQLQNAVNADRIRIAHESELHDEAVGGVADDSLRQELSDAYPHTIRQHFFANAATNFNALLDSAANLTEIVDAESLLSHLMHRRTQLAEMVSLAVANEDYDLQEPFDGPNRSTLATIIGTSPRYNMLAIALIRYITHETAQYVSNNEISIVVLKRMEQYVLYCLILYIHETFRQTESVYNSDGTVMLIFAAWIRRFCLSARSTIELPELRPLISGRLFIDDNDHGIVRFLAGGLDPTNVFSSVSIFVEDSLQLLPTYAPRINTMAVIAEFPVTPNENLVFHGMLSRPMIHPRQMQQMPPFYALPEDTPNMRQMLVAIHVSLTNLRGSVTDRQLRSTLYSRYDDAIMVDVTVRYPNIPIQYRALPRSSAHYTTYHSLHTTVDKTTPSFIQKVANWFNTQTTQREPEPMEQDDVLEDEDDSMDFYQEAHFEDIASDAGAQMRRLNTEDTLPPDAPAVQIAPRNIIAPVQPEQPPPIEPQVNEAEQPVPQQNLAQPLTYDNYAALSTRFRRKKFGRRSVKGGEEIHTYGYVLNDDETAVSNVIQVLQSYLVANTERVTYLDGIFNISSTMAGPMGDPSVARRAVFAGQWQRMVPRANGPLQRNIAFGNNRVQKVVRVEDTTGYFDGVNLNVRAAQTAAANLGESNRNMIEPLLRPIVNTYTVNDMSAIYMFGHMILIQLLDIEQAGLVPVFNMPPADSITTTNMQPPQAQMVQQQASFSQAVAEQRIFVQYSQIGGDGLAYMQLISAGTQSVNSPADHPLIHIGSSYHLPSIQWHVTHSAAVVLPNVIQGVTAAGLHTFLNSLANIRNEQDFYMVGYANAHLLMNGKNYRQIHNERPRYRFVPSTMEFIGFTVPMPLDRSPIFGWLNLVAPRDTIAPFIDDYNHLNASSLINSNFVGAAFAAIVSDSYSLVFQRQNFTGPDLNTPIRPNMLNSNVRGIVTNYALRMQEGFSDITRLAAGTYGQFTPFNINICYFPRRRYNNAFIGFPALMEDEIDYYQLIDEDHCPCMLSPFSMAFTWEFFLDLHGLLPPPMEIDISEEMDPTTPRMERSIDLWRGDDAAVRCLAAKTGHIKTMYPIMALNAIAQHLHVAQAMAITYDVTRASRRTYQVEGELEYPPPIFNVALKIYMPNTVHTYNWTENIMLMITIRPADVTPALRQLFETPKINSIRAGVSLPERTRVAVMKFDIKDTIDQMAKVLGGGPRKKGDELKPTKQQQEPEEEEVVLDPNDPEPGN